MAHRVALIPHLTTEQLAAAARACDNAEKRTCIEEIRLVVAAICVLMTSRMFGTRMLAS